MTFGSTCCSSQGKKLPENMMITLGDLRILYFNTQSQKPRNPETKSQIIPIRLAPGLVQFHPTNWKVSTCFHLFDPSIRLNLQPLSGKLVEITSQNGNLQVGHIQVRNII